MRPGDPTLRFLKDACTNCRALFPCTCSRGLAYLFSAGSKSAKPPCSMGVCSLGKQRLTPSIGWTVDGDAQVHELLN